MRIAVPTEIKNHEYRVGLTPQSVARLVEDGHTVFVQSGAGLGIGADDAAYEAVGALIVPDAEGAYTAGDLVVKVKEPQPSEWPLLRAGQVLFTYLHLAPDAAQTEALLASGAIAIAYETVTSPVGGLPLLRPMSEVAGRLSVQAGAHCLEREAGGKGVLLGGVTGVDPAQVVILGGGVVGCNAAQMALGLGAQVRVLDRSPEVLADLDRLFEGRLITEVSSAVALERCLPEADLLIGSVLVPGARAPHLVSREMVAGMEPGSVLVDVAIDQGGCFATSRATTHAEPTYVEAGAVHYCVSNMPGAVPRTATAALNQATLPFVRALAAKGCEPALRADEHLAAGLNVYRGSLTQQGVAEAQGLPWRAVFSVLG